MRVSRWKPLVLGLAAIGHLQAESGSSLSKPFFKSIFFNGRTYQHRWSNGGQHEFTPTGQEDLSSWMDMLTLWVDPRVRDAASLASEVDRVVASYRKINGQNLNVFFIPNGSERSGEYFISARLGNSPVVEFVAARFVLHETQGVGIMYSHRIYGPSAAERLIPWMESHGPELAVVLLYLKPSDLLITSTR